MPRYERTYAGEHRTEKVTVQLTPSERCKGRSKFRPLRRHRVRASSTDGSKGQKVRGA